MDITERIAKARAERGPVTGATGELVLTAKGNMEHLQGSFTRTFCGRAIDTERTAHPDRETYYPCLSCERAEQSRFC